MVKLTFNEDLCKGCGLCVDVCPRHVLVIAHEKINRKGHHPAIVVALEKCVGCASCAVMCPDCVITVEREEN